MPAHPRLREIVLRALARLVSDVLQDVPAAAGLAPSQLGARKDHLVVRFSPRRVRQPLVLLIVRPGDTGIVPMPCEVGRCDAVRFRSGQLGATLGLRLLQLPRPHGRC